MSHKTIAVTTFTLSMLIFVSSSAANMIPVTFSTNEGGNADLETDPGVTTNSVTLPGPDGGSLTMTVSIVEPTPGLTDMRIVSSGIAGLGVNRSGAANDLATQLDLGEVFQITFDQDVEVTEIQMESFRYSKEGDPSEQSDRMDLTIATETVHYTATSNFTGGQSFAPLDLSRFESTSLSTGQSLLVSPTNAGWLSVTGSSHVRLHSISVNAEFIPEPSALWLLGMGMIVPITRMRRREQ